MFRLNRSPKAPKPEINAHEIEPARDGRETIKSVAAALAENRITIAFQPVVNAKNFKIPAFQECLIRLIERNGSITPAASFMDIVEHSDLGRMVDRAVLRQVVNVLKSTQRVRLSVNLSANGVGDPEWLNILSEACIEHPQCGELLVVEITETAILNLSPEKLSFLNELRKLGCSIAIDDFGAGHTSIGQLGKFRFDFLKIDGSYIQDIENNQDHQFLISSMISIARHFEMVSIAEMVESEEAAQILTDLGVDCLQGYEFGKPELAPKWLTQSDNPSAWRV